MTYQYDDPVQSIPVDQINIVNTRSRAQEKFKQIISSIKTIGLKKPITVSPASGKHGPGAYDLVCGEGRLLAFRSLGEEMIPARVQNISSEDLLLMSLVENLAHRQARSAELLEEIATLKKRGYKIAQIAAKTDLTPTYVSAGLAPADTRRDRPPASRRKAPHTAQCGHRDRHLRRRRHSEGTPRGL